MNEIFELVYYSPIYQLLMPALVIISIILLIGTIVFGINLYKKNKKKNVVLICSLLSLFFCFVIYQAIPYYYVCQAAFSKDTNSYVEYLQKAIKTSALPVEKGFLYGDLGKFYAYPIKDGNKAIECYDQAYKYLKTYKSKRSQWGAVAAIAYQAKGDYDKAIEIYDEIGYYGGVAMNYSLKGNYEKALEYSNKNIKQYPNSYNFSQRAAIYRNLGKIDLAQADYEQALKLSKTQTERERVTKQFKNYKTYDLDITLKERKNLNF